MANDQKTEKLSKYSDKVTKDNIRPLWDVLSTLVTPEPKSRCEATLWSYDTVRPLLMEAGGLLTAKEAERRVLILENPGLTGESKITTSLYAGIQLVLP